MATHSVQQSFKGKVFNSSFKYFFQDWSANHGNIRSQMVLLFFRIAQQFHQLPLAWRWIGFPFFAFYELWVVWILGIEISYKATIGPGLKLFHGIATVIHESVVIGKNCTLRHSTTLGSKKGMNDTPVLGDDVDIGCHSVILGAIYIGHRAVIGAGSIVLHDVSNGSVVAGNPAHPIIRQRYTSQRQRCSVD